MLVSYIHNDEPGGDEYDTCIIPYSRSTGAISGGEGGVFSGGLTEREMVLLRGDGVAEEEEEIK